MTQELKDFIINYIDEIVKKEDIKNYIELTETDGIITYRFKMDISGDLCKQDLLNTWK